MHSFDDQMQELADEIIRYSLYRVGLDPVPLDGPKPIAELEALFPPNITE